MKSNSLNRLVGQSARGSLIVSAVLVATSACVYAQTSAEQRLAAKHQAERNALTGGNPIAQTKPTP